MVPHPNKQHYTTTNIDSHTHYLARDWQSNESNELLSLKPRKSSTLCYLKLWILLVNTDSTLHLCEIMFGVRDQMQLILLLRFPHFVNKTIYIREAGNMQSKPYSPSPMIFCYYLE
ncbi:unnamed protein product [Adineta ricciae]|uniref:Uncharacterized protein n=1 Tax=Adineta ricciae TaxID=249248 RepID=A0A815QM95_ADIRI|nr:unnamed protein product [Adineta ricciae]